MNLFIYSYLYARLSVVDDDSVGEVGSHDEVMFNDECGLLSVQDEPLDELRARDTLRDTGRKKSLVSVHCSKRNAGSQ